MKEQSKEKPGLSREQAAELYSDLKKAMGSLKAKGAQSTRPAASRSTADATVAAQIASAIRQGMKDDDKAAPPSERVSVEQSSAQGGSSHYLLREGARGQIAAMMLVLFFASFKVLLSALEGFGIMTAAPVQAAVQGREPFMSAVSQRFSPEEVRTLEQLDARRAELQQRSQKIEERDLELQRRDREFAVKLAELRALNDELRGQREHDQKKRNSQLDQLANVYGSMAPQEAATLMEQLDVSIALSLIERMPEKRIGQILALMNPQRALEVTKLLSARTSHQS
jgi:flagellar motility protein MotE (MotC chaperone)